MNDRAAILTSTMTLAGSKPHESAHLHVSGEAVYVDDIPQLDGTAFAALGLSERAHARVVAVDLSAVRSFRGVIDVILAEHIPGANSCGPILADDPILANEVVSYVGQPIFAVVAESYELARKAARLAKIEYENLPAEFSPEAAKSNQSFVVPVMHRSRGEAAAELEKSARWLKGKMQIGGQEQFYLEGQISYAVPKENSSIHIWCSTQHPSEMQHLIAHALHVASNQVTVEIRRMGGGFGGKESQSALFACVAAVAAQRLQRPVKLRLDRDDDFMITGKRHDFHYDYEVGYDEEGLIKALKIDLISRAGFSADLSGPVMSRAVCHVDNAYYLSDVDIHGYSAKTNTQSNTAFRGFGGPQGAFAIEYVIDNIARTLNKDPLDVRRLNFYGTSDRNTTHYGMTVEDNVIHQLVEQLEQSSEYRKRREAISRLQSHQSRAEERHCAHAG